MKLFPVDLAEEFVDVVLCHPLENVPSPSNVLGNENRKGLLGSGLSDSIPTLGEPRLGPTLIELLFCGRYWYGSHTQVLEIDAVALSKDPKSILDCLCYTLATVKMNDAAEGLKLCPSMR